MEPDEPKREELFDRIIQALAEMPDLLRQTFILSHYQGLSPDEIATKVDVKKQDVPFFLRRADRLLYQKLRPFIPLQERGSSRIGGCAEHVAVGESTAEIVERSLAKAVFAGEALAKSEE